MEMPASPKVSMNPPKRGFISHLKTFKRIAKDHIAVSLDSERTWLSWLQTQQEHAERFVRLNVSCNKDPPRLDDVQSMPQLRQYVQEQYALNRLIEDIAHRLVASSFYVIPATSANSKRKPLHESLPILISIPASEEIRCRLAPGEIQALGRWLSLTHKPYFIIRIQHDSASKRKIRLTDESMQSMTRSGEFSLPFNKGVDSQTTLEILLRLDDHGKEYMISGFPRTINEERSIGKLSNTVSSNNANTCDSQRQ